MLLHVRENYSRRKIAKQLGVDRATVRKYIDEYEEKRENLLQDNKKVDTGELIQSIVEKPKYKIGTRKKRKLTDEMIQKIQEHLKENLKKKQQGLGKQIKTAVDIHASLESEGYDISYGTVLRTIKALVHTKKEAFIKAEHNPGQACEFDWGEVKLIIDGKKRIIQMAVFTSAYSNFRMAYLFTKQKTECFQEAHSLFFKDVNGVFHTMVYDNMRVAVKKFIGNEKEPTEALVKLSLYYGFRHRFCNPASGNEKGHVERSVEVIRRKAFAFRDTFETLQEANQYLHEICLQLNQKPRKSHQQMTSNDLISHERDYLLSAPPPFDAARIMNGRVDKYSTIVVDQNHYSIPDYLVGEVVRIKVYSDSIQCFYREEKVATHCRKTGNQEWSLQLDHYLGTLKKKPGALATSSALQQASPKIKQIYQSYYITRPREFIELLHFMKSGVTLKEIECSITQLRSLHPSHVTTEKIKLLCAKQNEKQSPILTYSSQKTIDIEQHSKQHLQIYDQMFQTKLIH
ncbi:IS21 family transposase [Bacillus mycoides]|uniref:IS21 family transposase n=1 Tax=Bacillus mycoides TaxID=1405 RepID=A0A4U3AGK8_BACMY|nr:IS21 family transposase [Bacillus mycoides]